tara:strand:- start:885 stop:1097 length:213 start_codon:yes stop_codon:yes gene_type:complete
MKKSKYKVYVYEAYTKNYVVEAESEMDAIIKVEKNGERLDEQLIVGNIRQQIKPKEQKQEEFRIEEAVQL